MQIKSYTEAIEFIHGRRKFTKSPDLERMRRFAHYLGDPQKKTKFIHVTGTNGKGAFLFTACALITAKHSGTNFPTTTGRACLMIPAFAVAILAKVLSSCQC